MSLLALQAGHSSKALQVPSFLTTFLNIPRNAVAEQRLCAAPPFQGPRGTESSETPSSVLLAFLWVPRKHKAVAWGGRKNMRKEIKGYECREKKSIIREGIGKRMKLKIPVVRIPVADIRSEPTTAF